MTLHRALALIASALVLHLVLIQPNHPAAFAWDALLLFPLELPVILLALIAAGPGRVGTALRVFVVLALTLISVIKTADFAMFTALGRGFNPVSDMPLVAALMNLLTGSVGPILAMLALVAGVVAFALLAALLWWATGCWLRVEPPRPIARISLAGALLATGLAIADIGHTGGRWELPASPPGAAFTARVGLERIEMALRTVEDLRAFRLAAANDPFRDRDGLLDALDRDVLVIFVESYGRTSLDTPYFAEVHRATLDRAEARLGGLGLAMRSGLVASPTRGGQSWLAHATLANGLWVDSQTTHGAALASGRDSLFHIAARSGFRTAAVMPAITMDWPESETMGFGTVLPAAGLGYRGKPFNWVTMPDQFTLAALDRKLRTAPDPRPLFAQVALVSSHAPWVPVPELLDWDTLGDGEVFDAMATAGDSPETVWRDHDRVRFQYRLAIDYALRTVFDYAARHAADPPLILVVGDHQAAGFIALDERPDVPVHLIGPEHLVDRAAAWGWAEGLIPDPGGTVPRMDRLRDMILEAFTDTGASGGAS